MSAVHVVTGVLLVVVGYGFYAFVCCIGDVIEQLVANDTDFSNSDRPRGGRR